VGLVSLCIAGLLKNPRADVYIYWADILYTAHGITIKYSHMCIYIYRIIDVLYIIHKYIDNIIYTHS